MEVEFKLFGSMTVRQFVSLGGGIIIAALIYFLHLPIILGWPIMLSTAILGFAIAFMTVNGQPFSRWFKNFIVATFSSQKYVWRKNPETPKGLNYRSNPVQRTKSDKEVSKELGMIPIAEIVAQKNIELDEGEKADLGRIDKYFEAEFSKQFSSQAADNNNQTPVHENTQRVHQSEGNLAGQVNPIGRGQRNVDVGQGANVVYTPVTNQKQRPINIQSNKKEAREDEIIEQKVKQILAKQQLLNPYTKTTKLESEEKELRDEMRKLYNEIKELKEKYNG